MYNYSPIRKIYIQNFRNLGSVIIDFKDSPIISLVGDNEAGKTSCIKAIEVCALNAFQRKQPRYVRNGTPMFGVAIELEDGHMIKRMKSVDKVNGVAINSYVVSKIETDPQTGEPKETVLWYDTKIRDGVPEIVQKLLGLTVEPETKEFLNIRTYEDRLLFAYTPASVNYKVMHNALKADKISRAISNGNKEVNSLRNTLNMHEIQKETIRDAVESIKIYDIEQLKSVKNRLQKTLDAVVMLEKLIGLKNKAEKCRAEQGVYRLVETFKLQEIDGSTVLTLQKAKESYDKASRLRSELGLFTELNMAREVDTSLVDKLRSMISQKESLSASQRKQRAVAEIKGLSEIDLSVTQRLRSLIDKKAAYGVCRRELMGVAEISRFELIDLSQLSGIEKIMESKRELAEKRVLIQESKEKQKELSGILKENGVHFETCPNCGTDILIHDGEA